MNIAELGDWEVDTKSLVALFRGDRKEGKNFLVCALFLLHFITCDSKNNFLFIISVSFALFILYLLSDEENVFYIAVFNLFITVSMVFYMSPIIGGDSLDYWMPSKGIIVLNTRQNTLYNLIIFIFKKIHGNAVPADFALFQCLLAAVNIILIFHLAKKISSRKVALIASIIAGVWIPFIEFSSSVILTETAGITLGIIIMDKLIDSLRHNEKKDYMLLGLTLGTACLLKFSFYIWFLSVVIIVFIFSLALRRNILPIFLVLLPSFYLVTGIYHIRNYYFYGSLFVSSSGGTMLDATVNPYPGVNSSGSLSTRVPHRLLDPSKAGTGAIYSLPIVTFFNVYPFIENEHIKKSKTIDLTKDKDFIKITKRVRSLVALLLPPERVEDVMREHASRYRRNIIGKEGSRLALERYKSMVFTKDLYINTLLKIWDYVACPAFGRFSYYYIYSITRQHYSHHYINPLLIIFEHYSFLAFAGLGIVFYLYNNRKRMRASLEVTAISALSVLHLVGFSLAHIPEARYTFPILPFLFIIASYGFIESVMRVAKLVRNK